MKEKIPQYILHLRDLCHCSDAFHLRHGLRRALGKYPPGGRMASRGDSALGVYLLSQCVVVVCDYLRREECKGFFLEGL